MPFEIVRNDITRMRADAIVNAANSSLLGGGGVDGAIHLAAGPELLAECRKLGGCRTGHAKITGGYRLPCKYVIHTVGPVWQGGNSGEPEELASCYRESLLLAEKYGCGSVAFPLISAGAYGYPRDRALKIATDTILDFLLDHDMTVWLVIYDRASFSISQKLYANIQAFIDDEYVGPGYAAQERSRRRLNAMPDFLRPRREEAEDLLPTAPYTAGAVYGAAAPAVKEAAEEYADASVGGAGLESYLQQIDEGFRDMLLRKIDEKQMTDAECYRKANVDRKLFNKIKNQPDYRPGKTTVLALAVALRLPLPEVEEMLMKAGFALSSSSRLDLIVKYFILQGNYDVFEINEALFAFDQKLLGSAV